MPTEIGGPHFRYLTAGDLIVLTTSPAPLSSATSVTMVCPQCALFSHQFPSRRTRAPVEPAQFAGKDDCYQWGLYDTGGSKIQTLPPLQITFHLPLAGCGQWCIVGLFPAETFRRNAINVYSGHVTGGRIAEDSFLAPGGPRPVNRAYCPCSRRGCKGIQEQWHRFRHRTVVSSPRAPNAEFHRCL